MKDALFLFHALKQSVPRCETKCSSPRNNLFHTEKLLSLLAFGNFYQINSDTDKNNGKRLRPAKTVLSQSKGGNSCHNQNQITINGNHRCLQIFQTDRQQHITDSGRENTNIRIRKGVQWNGMENTGASNPVMNVTIIADTAAPEKV